MINKIKIWFKGIIEKLLSWGKGSTAEEDVPIYTPAELKALVERLKEALEKNPEDIKILYDLGEVFMKMHGYGEAILPLRAAVNIEADHKSARLQLGRVQMEMDRDDDALEHLKEAMRIDP